MYNYIILFCYIYLFSKSKNVPAALTSFFGIMFCIEVLLVEDIFGVTFSPRAEGILNLGEIGYVVNVFILIFCFITYRCSLDFDGFSLSTYTSSSSIILSILFTGIAVYFLNEKGIRVFGDFMNHTKDRYVYEDFIPPVLIALCFHYRCRQLLLAVLLFFSMVYLLAGERLRTFVYLCSVYLFLFGGKHVFKMKLGIVLSWVISMIIGYLRAGRGFESTLELIFASNNGYRMTHFGEVTVSSAIFYDFAQGLDLQEKIKFFLGILFSNLVPSSFLPIDYDVRRSLIAVEWVPGGGWFPMWLYCLTGWSGVIISSVVIGIGYRWIISKANRVFVNNERNAYYLFFTILVAGLPRWLMYTPYHVIRFPIYGVLFFIFLNEVLKSYEKPKEKV